MERKPTLAELVGDYHSGVSETNRVISRWINDKRPEILMRLRNLFQNLMLNVQITAEDQKVGSLGVITVELEDISFEEKNPRVLNEFDILKGPVLKFIPNQFGYVTVFIETQYILEEVPMRFELKPIHIDYIDSDYILYVVDVLLTQAVEYFRKGLEVE